MLIDLMKAEDLPQVAEIEKDTFSEPWSEKGFADSLALGDTLFLCVTEENSETGSSREVIGYCGLLQSFDTADITNVAVRSDKRGCGIGRRMLTELMKLGRERGVQQFTLEVRTGNSPAIHLYESLGFVSAGIRKGFYRKPAEDALIMWTEKQ